MKTSVKKDKCQVKLTVSLDADEMKAIRKDVEKVFLREAQLPGFRKGKVPLELIRKEFASGLKEEIQRAMLQKNYRDAVTAEAIDEVALADVQEIRYDDNGGEFTAVVDVKPTFKLPTYKGLKIAAADVAVSDDEVAKALEQMRTQFSKYEDAKEGDTASDGDFIQIDYTGTVDGKPITDLNADAKVVASGTGFWTQLEEGRFLPEILEAVKGMRAGETKDGVRAKFPKEGAPKGLEGKKAEYTVTLKTFRRRILPTDAEFVAAAKAESLEKLTAQVRTELEKAKVARESSRRESDAVELLMKKVDFDVPQTQVRRAMDAILGQLAERAQYTGMDAKYFEDHRDEILKNTEEQATKQVRFWYVIDEIAKAEKIEAKDEEKGKKVIELILANAK